VGLTDPVATFASEVGPPAAGPVVAVGGRTRYDVGGAVDPAAREVRAPAGIVAHDPADMTVRVRCATSVAELDGALAESRQCVAIPDRPGSTVGGALAVGASGLRALGWGPVRDTLLEARFVTAEGAVAVAGGPTVKNVSGYDLCRLLVGSLGTIGLLAEVVLRTRPVQQLEQWFEASDRDPWDLRRALHHPTSILWDGETSWVLLGGHREDVAAEAGATGLVASTRPPDLPPFRWSVDPASLHDLLDDGHGRFVAQIGVGIVHREQPQPARALTPTVEVLHRRLKSELDPTGRLAPGRSVGKR
jgi:FAD/FMN-containing dehydrogenase